MGESSEGEGFSSQHWIPIGIQPLGVSELGLMEKGEVAIFLFGVSYSEQEIEEYGKYRS